eukprot:4236996-Prymnesium_polylepis.1
MCHLETLSNELHETEGGAAGEACADDAGGAAEAKGGDATRRMGPAEEGGMARAAELSGVEAHGMAWLRIVDGA